MRNKRLPIIWLIIALLGLTLLLHQAATAKSGLAEPSAPTATADYPAWRPAIAITGASIAPNGARLPVVAASPNGTVMVGFLKQVSGDNSDTDLYYRTSTDNGSTWTPALGSNGLPIHTSPGVRSTELDIAYLANNNSAHAVWREGDTEIHYARQGQWAGNNSLILVDAVTAVSGPRMVGSGTNRVNIVWAEVAGGGQQSIQFRRSLDGGTSFLVIGQIARGGQLLAHPALVVNGNTVHLVWQEGIVIPNISGAKVYYARGTVNEGANNVTWEGPVEISVRSEAFDAKQPDILLDGNTLHVSYTDRGDGTLQAVHHLECAANCLEATSWQSSGNISGQKLSVYASDPYDIISTLGSLNGCTMVYFHGSISQSNEQVIGTNSCSNWAQSAPDFVSSLENRAINPRMLVKNGWWVYMVYQEIQVVLVNGNPTYLPPQIRFVRNNPSIYLPVIAKP